MLSRSGALDSGQEQPEIPISTYQRRFTPRQRRQKRVLMTHKCRGSIIAFLISKGVEPNEEQKEMISGFQPCILCKH